MDPLKNMTSPVDPVVTHDGHKIDDGRAGKGGAETTTKTEKMNTPKPEDNDGPSPTRMLRIYHHDRPVEDVSELRMAQERANEVCNEHGWDLGSPTWHDLVDSCSPRQALNHARAKYPGARVVWVDDLEPPLTFGQLSPGDRFMDSEGRELTKVDQHRAARHRLLPARPPAARPPDTVEDGPPVTFLPPLVGGEDAVTEAFEKLPLGARFLYDRGRADDGPPTQLWTKVDSLAAVEHPQQDLDRPGQPMSRWRFELRTAVLWLPDPEETRNDDKWRQQSPPPGHVNPTPNQEGPWRPHAAADACALMRLGKTVEIATPMAKDTADDIERRLSAHVVYRRPSGNPGYELLTLMTHIGVDPGEDMTEHTDGHDGLNEQERRALTALDDLQRAFSPVIDIDDVGDHAEFHRIHRELASMVLVRAWDRRRRNAGTS